MDQWVFFKFFIFSDDIEGAFLSCSKEEEFCICFLEAEYKALLPFYGGPGSGVFFVDKNI